MATEKQITANRLNAQKSTGPKTPEGKTVVSRNALTHGLLARQAVLTDEDLAEFDQFHQDMMNNWAPVGPMEILLTERIVALSWRLKRAGRIETGMLNVMSREFTTQNREKEYLNSNPRPWDGSSENHLIMLKPDAVMSCAAMIDLANANKLPRLLHYEGRIERSLYKAILELQKLQYIRKHNEAFYGDAQNVSDRPNDQQPATCDSQLVSKTGMPISETISEKQSQFQNN